MLTLIPFGIVAAAWWWSQRLTPLRPGERSFTFYYWKKCGHCRAMYPEMRRLGSAVGNIAIRWVEDSVNDELEVRSFPTLIYRDSSGAMQTYEGQRNAAAIRAYLLQKQDDRQHTGHP